MNYYLFFGERSQGPFSASDVREFIRSGIIDSETPICQEGEDSWKAIHEEKSLESDPSLRPFITNEPSPAPKARNALKKTKKIHVSSRNARDSRSEPPAQSRIVGPKLSPDQHMMIGDTRYLNQKQAEPGWFLITNSGAWEMEEEALAWKANFKLKLSPIFGKEDRQITTFTRIRRADRKPLTESEISAGITCHNCQHRFPAWIELEPGHDTQRTFICGNCEVQIKVGLNHGHEPQPQVAYFLWAKVGTLFTDRAPLQARPGLHIFEISEKYN